MQLKVKIKHAKKYIELRKVQMREAIDVTFGNVDLRHKKFYYLSKFLEDAHFQDSFMFWHPDFKGKHYLCEVAFGKSLSQMQSLMFLHS